MPRRSALDPHKDQIAQWISEGKTNAWMAAKLEVYGIKRTPQQVGSYAKKLIAPTLSKVSARAQTVLTKIEGLVDALQAAFEEVQAMEDMPLPLRNKYRTLIELINTSAKIQGFGLPQVAVAVQVNQGADFKKRLWEILEESKSSASFS